MYLSHLRKYLNARKRSFGYAFRGLRYFFNQEAHAKIHLLATVSVLLLAFVLEVNQQEWLILIITIALVLSAEAINTALEKLTDLASPEFHPLAGQVKDIAAGAVLITAITALIVGLIIFLPYLLSPEMVVK